MQSVATITFLLILLTVTALVIKLSAVILRHRVASSHAFAFAVLVMVLSWAGQSVSAARGHIVGIGASFMLELALGAWFFGDRAKRRAGDKAGWARGFALTLVAQFMLVALGLALIWFTKTFVAT